MITIFLGGELGILGGRNNDTFLRKTESFFLITIQQINCNGDLSKPVKQYVTISTKWLQVNIRNNEIRKKQFVFREQEQEQHFIHISITGFVKLIE